MKTMVRREGADIVANSRWNLVDGLQLLKPILRARQTKRRRLDHQTKLGVDIVLLLLVGECMPRLPLQLLLAFFGSGVWRRRRRRFGCLRSLNILPGNFQREGMSGHRQDAGRQSDQRDKGAEEHPGVGCLARTVENGWSLLAGKEKRCLCISMTLSGATSSQFHTADVEPQLRHGDEAKDTECRFPSRRMRRQHGRSAVVPNRISRPGIQISRVKNTKCTV